MIIRGYFIAKSRIFVQPYRLYERNRPLRKPIGIIQIFKIMKAKPILIFAAVLAMLIPNATHAQIGRNEWSYGLIFQSDNIVYSAAGMIARSLPAILALDGENQNQMERVGQFYVDNKWWIPDFRYRANVLQRMEFADGRARIFPKAWGLSHLDWALNNYAVGYHVGYLSRIFPIGFDIQVDYAQDGYRIQMEGAEDKTTIIKRMVTSTALAKIRLMKYDSHRINPVIEIGGSYNYAFHYHDNIINDKNAVNSGLSGIIGLGFTNTETHISWSLRYEHAFFNYYNQNYLYEGVPIFEGSKSSFGRLGIALSYGF